MARHLVHRRAVLRGAAGALVGLPALELFAPRRAEAAIPRRFVLSYGGISTGTGTARGDLATPAGTGPGYELRRALRPLSDLGIQSAVSVVSGLVLPWQEGGAVPPGGRTAKFHFNTVGSLVAGTTGSAQPRGPTADQLVADQLAAGTLHRVMAVRVQPIEYIGDSQSPGNNGRLSWRQDGGRLSGVDPIVSPRLGFESLFSGFAPPAGASAAAARRLRQRKSVLDMVAGDTQRLLARLGAADRLRLERHLDEVRALEMRVAAQPPGGGAAACVRPAAPGGDPPIGKGFALSGDSTTYDQNVGYSDEERRADLLSDQIAMAFACDLSRVASYMITTWKCWMNMFQVAGWKSDMHELSHSGPADGLADGVAFVVRQWGKLVKKLAAVHELDGSSLLDHAALVLQFEGGWGYDPETRRQSSTHSTENMIALVAGRAGRLRAGSHVRASGRHPAQVVVSAMNAVGVMKDLGDVKGNIPELFA